PVTPPEVKATCRVSHILATDTNDRSELQRILRALTERLGRRLRQSRHAVGALIITVRHADDTTATRKARLSRCTLDIELWRAACNALDRALTRRIAVRSIAVTATDLHDESVQFELWQDTAALSEPKAAALQRAVDRVRAVTATGAPSSRAEAATAAAVEGSLAFASVPMQEVAPLRSRVAAAPVGMTSRDPSTSRSLRDRSGR